MTQLLMIVGVFVFFISVYGAVMVGGHLLAQLEDDDVRPNSFSNDTGHADASAVTGST